MEHSTETIAKTTILVTLAGRDMITPIRRAPDWRAYPIMSTFAIASRFRLRFVDAPSASAGFPTVKISPRGSARLKDGHVWVYRSDIVSADEVPPGSLVRVTDHRGKPLGTALYSSSSQIAIRMLSRTIRSPTFRPCSASASPTPSPIASRSSTTPNAYRVIFSEADFLPGLIVDRYNDMLSLQILTQAMDADPVREAILAATRRTNCTPLPSSSASIRGSANLETLPPPRVRSAARREICHHLHHEFQCGSTMTPSKARRPEPFSTSARTMPPPPIRQGRSTRRFLLSGRLCAAPRASLLAASPAVDSSRPALEVADQNAALNQRF